MKGQFVFEFLIAGLIFFVIVVYSINYLNVSVSDFKTKFYSSRLQSKAVQVSEILMKGSSSISFVENSVFSLSKIQNFNDSYCNLTDAGSYPVLLNDMYLYEHTPYGREANYLKILMINTASGETFLDCGPRIPRNVTRAEVGRVGLLGNELMSLSVVVW